MYEGALVFDPPVSSQGINKDGPVQSWSLNWVPPLNHDVTWTLSNGSDGKNAVDEQGLTGGPPVHLAVCPSCDVIQAYAGAHQEIRDVSDWWTTLTKGKRVEFSTPWRPFNIFYTWAAFVWTAAGLAVLSQFGRWGWQVFARPSIGALGRRPVLQLQAIRPPDPKSARPSGKSQKPGRGKKK